MERLRSYFSFFLNETNEYQLEVEDKVEGSIWGVTEQMVDQVLKSMKVGKAPEPPGVTSDFKKAAGATGVSGRFQVCESIDLQAC